ncbi:polysaccharide deacetylase family protein [Formosa sp. PL04]|uniref:polysaccharide deacetylase family protein n=1 Tax=Formosa sp. PL04 TaxID=3081755 RepID=UPI002980E321|nr:polysaccharide deacetylase family protein [Formosa sp. PL04]MDW5287783.1 polysaccharide deacetylase family protein [Formosa sp. PL04]
MLLVYTHKITPRIKFTFKHLCTRILGIPVSFTTTIEEFIAHDSFKMSYTRQPLGREIFIRSHELLFEQGISDPDLNVANWDDTKCFFFNGDKSAIPYDIFAASFYLLSRYEEYLPHVKDEYGRYVANESLAYRYKFLNQPVVDIWAYKFKEVLKAHYPDHEFTDRTYGIKPVIDVPTPYDFRLKGLMRTFGGTIKDLFAFSFKRFYYRYMVLFGLKRDPYDTFKYILNKQKQTKYKFHFFFLIGDYSTYDKGVSVYRKDFVSLIKSVADYCKVGLKVSYFAIEDKSILKEEHQRMEGIINTSLMESRNSFSKLNLPDLYRNLVELEVQDDYTMGYVNEIGFRAGTCTPFFFYDLDYEVQTPLRINSYHVIDSALLKYASLLDKKESLQYIINQVKRVNGEFVPVFHNYTFSGHGRWKDFKELFNIILDSTEDDK